MENVTHEELINIVKTPGIINVFRSEMGRQDRIEHTRLWRMAMILPGEDDVRNTLFPSKSVLIGVPEKSKAEKLTDIAFDLSLLKDGFEDLLGDITDIAQEEFWEKRILRTIRDGWLCHHKIRTRHGFGGWIKVPAGIEVESVEAFEHYLALPKFLRQLGFPLSIERPTSPDFFTMEISGVVVLYKNKQVKIIRDPYFIRRSLIDDEGNLIYLGLDEGITEPSRDPYIVSRNERWMPFPVNFFPWMGYKLLKYSEKSLRYVKFVDYTPLFRYSCFPITTNTPLPLIDTPIIDNSWVDVFLLTGGKALVFFPFPGVDFNQMISELYALWEREIKKKDYKLLSFTKDIDHVETYLKLKMQILRQYYELVEFPLHPTASDHS